MKEPSGRLDTRPQYLDLGVGCSITAIALVYALVAMVLPNGFHGLTTVRSGIMVIIVGVAIGWLLSLRYFRNEPIAPGRRGLHFPVMYQFEDFASWRFRYVSMLDALARGLETLGQLGWLFIMPLHRFTHPLAGQKRTL